MKILILGAEGQLGKAAVLHCKQEVVPFFAPRENEANICDFDRIKKVIAGSGCTHILNCAAYNNVDRAEEDAKAAFLVNADAVKNLAEICQNLKVKLVHFSTDYVFDGKASKPYTENDVAVALSKYGQSKLEGEKNALRYCENSLVIRTSWVFGEGINFIAKVLEWSKNGSLKIADDEFSSPTSAKLLAKIALALLKKERSGLFQICCRNGCSRYDLARFVLQEMKIAVGIEKVSKSIFGLPAKRPDYSFMSTEKVEKSLGIELPFWEDEVRNFLKEKKDTEQ